MTEPPATLDYAPPAQTGAPLYLRMLLLLLLICVGVVVGYIFIRTPLGAQLRNRKAVHAWVEHNRLITPLLLVGLYVLFGTCMLPVWWIQMSAGYCFGLRWGVLWCEIGAVITAMLSLNLSRWMFGEWFHRKYESRMVKLRQFDEKLGHNGLLVVMTIRLAHVMPFGISNYLFGLTRITTIDVALGTFFGGSVAVSFYVAIGVGQHILRDWRYWTVVSIVNVLLLVPLILRYLFPDWFKKIGIE